MSEKKRKRQDGKYSDRPHKKTAIEGPPENVKVSIIEDGDQWTPILGVWLL